MSTVELKSKIEEVWKWLTDEQTWMIGIHGVGGVGKTTLLKQIYKRLTTSTHDFDTVIWVTVSQNLSSEKVQDDIWKRIGVFDVEWVDKNFQQKAEAIRLVLSQKKFALLLDDLAERLDLQNLGVLDPDEPENKWTVIFTTRSNQVCSDMDAQVVVPIKSLALKYAWELFKTMVGEDDLWNSKFFEMAQVIARSCRGLPMLLRTVGRAMAKRTTYEEWEAAIKVMRSAQDENDYVDFLLQFCFDTMDSQLESCLMYYSVFPEDFTVLKTELIDFWICQQLLQSDLVEDVLYLGYKAIDALIWSCLLEEEENKYVKMLDLIRDMLLNLKVRSSSTMSKPATSMEVVVKKEEAGWVLPMKNSIQGMQFSHNLLAFLLKHNPFIMMKSAFFVDQPDLIKKYITILDLSNSGVEKIPREIAELVSLEYLNLSHTWIDHLPVEMKMLVNLKCLNLEYDEQLRVIPKQLVSSLFSLRVLKMFRCGFSVEEIDDNIMSATHMDIDPIFRLKHLKVLSMTITCDHALSKFFGNRGLLNRTQSLSLEIFWGTESLDISQVATMKNLLTFEVRQVEKLKQLNGFPPSFEFVKETSFEKLQEITFDKCSSLRELTWVILVPNLKILIVKNCEEIEEISSKSRIGEILDNEEGFEPFTKLELLALENLPELKSIYWRALPFESLERIKVIDCCLLKKLPLNSRSGKESEVVIEAEECWRNGIEWEDDITKNKLLRCVKLVEVEPPSDGLVATPSSQSGARRWRSWVRVPGFSKIKKSYLLKKTS